MQNLAALGLDFVGIPLDELTSVSLVEADLQLTTEVIIEHLPGIVDGKYDVRCLTIQAHEVHGSSLLPVEGLLQFIALFYLGCHADIIARTLPRPTFTFDAVIRGHRE